MLSGISPGSLLLILLIVILLFGTKKLRNVGADLGAAIRSFRKASQEGNNEVEHADDNNKVIENAAHRSKDE
jgi:sec-independent protein translocase protein TatA